MNRLTLQALSCAAIFTLCGPASAGSVLTAPGKVTALVLFEGDNAMRIGAAIPGPAVNPAGCDTVNAGFALQLDAPGRSAEETRMLLNNAQLAFMTGRPVQLYVRDDLCYTMGGFPHRVVSGIVVTN